MYTCLEKNIQSGEVIIVAQDDNKELIKSQVNNLNCESGMYSDFYYEMGVIFND